VLPQIKIHRLRSGDLGGQCCAPPPSIEEAVIEICFHCMVKIEVGGVPQCVASTNAIKFPKLWCILDAATTVKDNLNELM
jgi:hypothetical protein